MEINVAVVNICSRLIIIIIMIPIPVGRRQKLQYFHSIDASTRDSACLILAGILKLYHGEQYMLEVCNNERLV